MAFGTAETAKLVVDLSLTGNFQSQLGKVNKTLATTGARLSDTSSRAYKAGQQIGTGIKRGTILAVSAIGALTGLLALSVKEGQEAAKVQEIYATAVRNSGKVTTANVAALNKQQKALENLAGVDDELIKTEQTRLIQMGLTGDQVLTLTPAVLDFSKATGIDLLTATKLAGKAAQGNTGALKRYGIEIDKAKAKTDPFGATLDALNKKFGGTTKALSGDFSTRMEALRQALADIREDAGQKLLPALTRIVDVVGSKLVPAFGKFIDRILPSVITGLDQFSKLLENGGAEKAINGITDALGPLVDLVKIAAAPVKAIVSAFLSLPHEIQTVLIGAFAVNKLTGGLVTNVFGGIAEAIAKSFIRAPLVNVQGGVVNVAGAVPTAGIPATVGKGAGIVSAVLGVGTAAAIGLAVAAAFKGIFQDPGFKEQTDKIDKSVHEQITGNRTLGELKQSEAALKQGIADLTVVDKNGNPVPLLNDIAGLLYGGQKDDLQNQLTLIQAAIAAAEHPKPSERHKDVTNRKTTASQQEARRGKIEEGLHDNSKQTKEVQNRLAELKNKTEQKLVVVSKDIESVRGTLGNNINPSVIGVGGDVEAARGAIVGAIAQKDLSVNQQIAINVNVSASGVTKQVTIQNRYGPGNGSSGRDLGGPNGSGGGVNSGAG